MGSKGKNVLDRESSILYRIPRQIVHMEQIHLLHALSDMGFADARLRSLSNK